MPIGRCDRRHHRFYLFNLRDKEKERAEEVRSICTTFDVSSKVLSMLIRTFDLKVEDRLHLGKTKENLVFHSI